MDNRVDEVAALANAVMYDSTTVSKYIDMAPHIRHPSLRNLYAELVVRVFDGACENCDVPRILDLGDGEGSATLPLLKLGARVTAIDISQGMIDALMAKCADHKERLEAHCQDVLEAIESFKHDNRCFDIVIASSFLHHIPDYLELIERACTIISPRGQFLSFQDPLRYDSLGRFTRFAHDSWRLLQGDVIGGIKRRLRRNKGTFLDIPEDNTEYHYLRGGVDQDAIMELFKELGFDCDIICYFSTDGAAWQHLGDFLGMENNFAVVARKRSY